MAPLRTFSNFFEKCSRISKLLELIPRIFEDYFHNLLPRDLYDRNLYLIVVLLIRLRKNMNVIIHHFFEEIQTVIIFIFSRNLINLQKMNLLNRVAAWGKLFAMLWLSLDSLWPQTWNLTPQRIKFVLIYWKLQKHFWNTCFLTFWDKELAVISPKYEKSRSEIENKIRSQKLILMKSFYFYQFWRFFI